MPHKIIKVWKEKLNLACFLKSYYLINANILSNILPKQ